MSERAEGGNGQRRPGLWRMIRARIAAPYEEAVLREEQARADRARVQAATSIFEEIVRRVEPEEDEFTGKSWPLKNRQLDEGQQTELRSAALEASLTSPHLIGYLKSLKRFVLGKGPTFRPILKGVEGEPRDKLSAALETWWGRFCDLNDWDSMEDEIPVRGWRDGETFVRRFVQAREGPMMNATLGAAATALLARRNITGAQLLSSVRRAPAGMVFLRVIPPEQIADPEGKITHGIVTAEQDVRTVLGYCYAPPGADGQPAREVREIIPASDMLHVAFRKDSDVKRGRSLLEPLLKLDKYYSDWLRYRLALNLARTAIVLVKKVEGTPGQIEGIRQQQASQRDTGTDNRQRMLRPMTTIHASPGISYEFLSPNLNATDARTDGRNITLAMAAATGLPEYMFTGDASNANFASTMVAEAPAIREFEDQQDFLTPAYRRIWYWVMEAAARAKAIAGLDPAALERGDVDVEIVWPPMVARDEQKDTDRRKVLHDGMILSDEGWALAEGLDWETEKKRLLAERDTSQWPLARVLDVLAKLTGAGALTPDPALENQLRALVQLPPRLEDQALT